jgi:hypothetical protein
MIARHWRGWTKLHDADTYESLLKQKVLPELKKLGATGVVTFCATMVSGRSNSWL